MPSKFEEICKLCTLCKLCKVCKLRKQGYWHHKLFVFASLNLFSVLVPKRALTFAGAPAGGRWSLAQNKKRT